jgi:LmbE family N-acetylglucosaminyl deacetylase
MSSPRGETHDAVTGKSDVDASSSSPAATAADVGGRCGDDDRVLRRPHFELRGDALFFLVSTRPFARLAAREVAIWNAFSEGPAELRERWPGESDAIVERLLRLGVCEVARAPSQAPRRRIVVIEPHSDDAVLSVGGTMWRRRESCEFLVVTVGSRSNFTSYYLLDRDFFDADAISKLRNAEAELVARMLGGKHLAVGQREATLRYRDGDWTLDWFRRHRHSVSAFIAHGSSAAELTAWARSIAAVLRDTGGDEVWIPIGVGPHTDHELTRNACVAALLAEPALTSGRTIRFYQEVPYASRFRGFSERIVRALSAAGAVLIPEPSPVGDLAHKLRLVSVYGSQFKLEVMRDDVEESARLAGGGTGPAEMFWRVERLPRTLEPESLFVDAPLVREAAPRVRTWARRNRDAHRIRLLLLLPPGRWREDMEDLLARFPRATFEVYASPGAAAEVAELQHDRICTAGVVAGIKAWATLSLRLAVAPPRPTLFLAGLKRLAVARLLALLWPLSAPLVLPSMDHLLRALRVGDTPSS